MSSNFVNQNPYLRTSRNYPEDPQALTVEVNKSYVDIANAVNQRTIGIFANGRPSVTGESWFFTSQKQQSIRQVYTFTSTGNIAHNIPQGSIYKISKSSNGQFTDGTNYYGVIFASNVSIAGQVTFYVTSTNIVVIAGAGAPAITSGYIDLEWLVQN